MTTPTPPTAAACGGAAYERGYQNGQATLEARVQAAYGCGYADGVITLLVAEVGIALVVAVLWWLQ